MLRTQIPPPPEQEPDVPPENDLFYEYETKPASDESLIAIDQKKYIGILSIPALGLELLVMSEWSYPNLKLAPCRYYGTVADANLIIAAHNYRTHFGTLNQLTAVTSSCLRKGTAQYILMSCCILMF